ncbi:MAG: DUF6318 family protein [Bowdeniella nasicola]|nr:DUF6318 family protein [Bowdeniella nasicola]
MLRRVGIVAALVGSAVLLSGCGGDKEPAAVAVTPGAPVPSPSWTPPPAGMWTESDLAEGREVPPEEMDRLRPVIEIPQEPATMTHNTEQGAKDAAEYLAWTVAASVERGDPSLLEEYVSDSCMNCASVHEVVKRIAESPQRARCGKHSISVGKVVAGTGEVPFYDVEIKDEDKACLSFNLDNNLVEKEYPDEMVSSWYVVQYLDGKWVPYNISLTERPVYESN